MTFAGNRKACLARWWPDQAAASVIVACALAALAGDTHRAVDGVGLGTFLPYTVMVGWFIGLLVAGVVLFVATERDSPRLVACSLTLAAVLFAANGAVTLIAKDVAALGATAAYVIAAIFLIKRAQDAGHIYVGRARAHRVAEHYGRRDGLRGA